MTFKIEVSIAAKLDMRDGADHIALDSRRHALRWARGLNSELLLLRQMPLRFPLIQEAEELRVPLRSFHYFSHRVIYEVNEPKGVVTILRVLHNSRRPLSIEDVTGPE